MMTREVNHDVPHVDLGVASAATELDQHAACDSSVVKGNADTAMDVDGNEVSLSDEQVKQISVVNATAYNLSKASRAEKVDETEMDVAATKLFGQFDTAAAFFADINCDNLLAPLTSAKPTNKNDNNMPLIHPHYVPVGNATAMQINPLGNGYDADDGKYEINVYCEPLQAAGVDDMVYVITSDALQSDDHQDQGQDGGRDAGVVCKVINKQQHIDSGYYITITFEGYTYECHVYLPEYSELPVCQIMVKDARGVEVLPASLRFVVSSVKKRDDAAATNKPGNWWHVAFLDSSPPPLATEEAQHAAHGMQYGIHEKGDPPFGNDGLNEEEMMDFSFFLDQFPDI